MLANTIAIVELSQRDIGRAFDSLLRCLVVPEVPTMEFVCNAFSRLNLDPSAFPQFMETLHGLSAMGAAHVPERIIAKVCSMLSLT